MKKIFRINVLTDIGLLLFGAFWLWKSFDIHLHAFNDVNAWGTMGTIPIFMTICLLALSLADLIRNIVKNSKMEVVEKTKEEKRGILYLLIEIAVLIVYSFVMDKIGYIISTILLLVITMLLSGSRNWKLIACISVGTTVGLYVLFRYALIILLPTLFL